MHMRISIAALIAGAALAAGVTYARAGDLASINKLNSSVRCYAKVWGVGSFPDRNLAVGTVTMDGLGGSDLGVSLGGGCDIASGFWLAGIGGDYTWHQGSATVTVAGIPAMSVPTRDEGTVFARLGVLPSDRTVIYGLAGYTASTGSNATMVGVPLNLGGPNGATVGGGIEVALWQSGPLALTATLEYRHTSFANQSSVLATLQSTEDQVRAGIGLRF